MNAVFTEPFKKDYAKLPSAIKQTLDKALKFLLANPRHPALHAKKLPGISIWYARINRTYRFTFQYKNGAVILRRAGTHDILNSERKS